MTFALATAPGRNYANARFGHRDLRCQRGGCDHGQLGQVQHAGEGDSLDPRSRAGTTLSTQSNGLTITTGIPSQSAFSLAATKLNFEAWEVDGNTTVLTAFLADHFNNPVPDGTVVNFTTGGGTIVGTCSTTNSTCNVTMTGTNPRPANGRVTVLAFAIGEESFTDLNGNGVADLLPANEMVDVNGNSTAMGEAFRDDAETGVYQAGEPFIDYNGNGVYNVADPTVVPRRIVRSRRRAAVRKQSGQHV